jgi:hypothetical protein
MELVAEMEDDRIEIFMGVRGGDRGPCAIHIRASVLTYSQWIGEPGLLGAVNPTDERHQSARVVMRGYPGQWESSGLSSPAHIDWRPSFSSNLFRIAGTTNLFLSTLRKNHSSVWSIADGQGHGQGVVNLPRALDGMFRPSLVRLPASSVTRWSRSLFQTHADRTQLSPQASIPSLEILSGERLEIKISQKALLDRLVSRRCMIRMGRWSST